MDVLVLDDDAANRELMGIILESAGHRPRLAAGVTEATAALATDPSVRAVVTDLALGPDREDGYRFITSLRADPATAEVLIVVVTGVTSPVDLQRARDLGADLCVAKPIDVDAFLRTLGDLAAPLDH